MSAEFTGEQKLRIVLESIIRGVPKEEQCKKYGITDEQFQTWHDHLLKNGGSIYEQGNSRTHKSRTKKVKFIPWYFSVLLTLSIMINLGGGIVWAVWQMASPHKGESMVDIFSGVSTTARETNDSQRGAESLVISQDELGLQGLLEEVDDYAFADKDSDPSVQLSDNPLLTEKREMREVLSDSLKLPLKPDTLDLAAEVEFLGQNYEGKHVVYLVDVGGYQLNGDGAVERLDRMKVALLESLTKLSSNSFFNLVLCWNLREAHALGKTILRASDENKKFATDWITSLRTNLEGLKEGRNQFYPKELLYAKPLAGVVGPWYGLATAMSYDPDLVFFFVGNMPGFVPDEVSRLDFNGLGLDSDGLNTGESNVQSHENLKPLIRKTAGYWLLALQSERNLPETSQDIEDIAMTRLGLDDWANSKGPVQQEIPWDKAFDNFLAGLELGIDKIPQIHAFQTLSEPTVWPSSLQNSMAEFCESSRGSMTLFP